MKKIVLYLLCIVSCTLCIEVSAQVKCDRELSHKCDMQHKHRAEFFAQMRAKKLVYLVDAMQLTETEKVAFAVLFEKHETETGECYRAMREAKKALSAEPTDEEYENAVEVSRVQMLKIAQIRADYLEKLKKILPAKKIYKLYEAEEAYKKLLISDMGKCRQQPKK
jgi:hypothetical protein